MYPTTSICAEGGLVLHVFLDAQFLFNLSCASQSFSFSVMVSSLIEVNLDKDVGSTLGAFAVMDILA